MNRDQIEGMARIICKPTSNKGNCEKCGFEKQCSKFDDAIRLYNADYRKLPCKIGDTVYAISNYAGVKKIRSGKVSQMFYVGEEMQLCIVVSKVGRGTWGNGIFATEEEAQAAINERKRG